MSELRDLYQEVILDHNRRPRNWGTLDPADRRAEGHNPLCGDQLLLTLRLAADRIGEVRFEGSGCAISKASASLMTEAIQGRTMGEVEDLFARFHDLLTGDPAVREQAGPALGKLAVFEGVREFPVRVKCATLPWHTLRAALQEQRVPVSTE